MKVDTVTRAALVVIAAALVIIAAGEVVDQATASIGERSNVLVVNRFSYEAVPVRIVE